MTEPITLADVQEAVVDDATLDQLFFDLSQLAEILEVRIKASSEAHAAPVAPTLEAARSAIGDRTALAIQLRYRYRGEEWIDTLMRISTGFRVVRVKSPSPS